VKLAAGGSVGHAGNGGRERLTAAHDDWGAILDRLLAGDRLAFLKVNRLISGCLAQVRAYDYREEWDDLRQEVMLAIVAAARAGRLREPQAFVGYVRSITRNHFADRLDRARRTHEKQQVEWDDATAAAVTLAGAAGGDGRARDVWFAVADLPDQHRVVIDGVYRLGKTYDEVARDTGIPLGTVKRRLREGLEALRQRLQEGGEG
jgi:RNA polymerase sigma-70 factor (ECF subfamily)